MHEFDPKKFYTFNKKLKAFSIDIPLDEYLDVYHDWDFSPLKKRDLDENLHDYLMSCSSEIPLRYSVIINLHLPIAVKNSDKEHITRQGFRNYYQYRIYKATIENKKLTRQITYYIFFGLLFLVSAFVLQRLVNLVMFLSILPEGLFIGGWVLFWEAFSIIFFKTNTKRQQIKKYNWLRQANLNFIYRYKKENLPESS